MKVLIGTDGSRDAQIAFETALRLLKCKDRNVDLLCVAPRDRKRGDRQYERRILAEATAILERTRRTAGAQGIRTTAAFGSVAEVILHKAETYDLTVLGAKGLGAGANVGLGPVASRVAEHSTSPVLIARELRSESGARILVAADGSSASLAAIRTLAELFDLGDSEITLLHVKETPWVHLGLDEEWSAYDHEDDEHSDADALERELTREGDALIEQARDLLRESDAAITTVTKEGNPADEILSEADRGQYDLIVVGASGSRDLKHSMLGSVSAKVAWNAPGSVLIVREPA